MGTVLAIALWGLAILCLIVGLAIVLPLRLELEVRKGADWQAAAVIRPFGRYGARIPLKKGPERPKTEKRQKKKKRRKRRSVTRDPRTLFPVALRFAVDVLGCIRVGKLTANAHFGLGDPALTGQAFGMLCPVIYGSSAHPGVQVDIVPVFDRPLLTGAADMTFSVVPLMLLGPIIRFGWHIVRTAR